MNCAEYRQQFLEIIRIKSLQQTPHLSSSQQSPLGNSPNKSEHNKSIALSSTDTRAKVRPPLKIKKLTQPKAYDTHKNSQTTAISKFQSSSNSNRSTQDQNSRTMACHSDHIAIPQNDLTMQVGCAPTKVSKSDQITFPCTLNATSSNGESEIGHVCYVDAVIHSTVKSSTQECPTGSFFITG